RVTLLIGAIRRVGVMTSLSVGVFGTVISFLHHPDYTSVPAELARLTSPGAAFPQTLREVWQGVRQGRGQSVVVVGLLLLIATPVIRVAVSVFAFVYQRDRVFVAITSLVLALLLLSFVLGKAG